MLTPDDIKPGRVFACKRPAPVGFLEPLLNDRMVMWVSSCKSEVQYDSPSVARGRRFPRVSMEKFLAWAVADVTEQCPTGKWRTPNPVGKVGAQS